MLYPTPCAARSFARADRVSADGFRRRGLCVSETGSLRFRRRGLCVSVREPPIGFQAPEARAVRRQIFHPSARAKSVVGRWVPDFRIPVDVLARTSSRGRRRRRRRREARRGSGRRERDASATRARRERDANRREPTTVRAAAIERRGATEARARRFAFDLESRRSFASTREFRRVEGANADDARARDVG